MEMPYQLPEVADVDDAGALLRAAQRMSRGEAGGPQPRIGPDGAPASDGGAAPGESDTGRPCVVVITPQRLLLGVPLPEPAQLGDALASAVDQLIEPRPPKRVTVIAQNDFAEPQAEIPDAIPFFGYLLGIAQAGHAVVLFEGHESLLPDAARESELLIIDELVAPLLKPGWDDVIHRLNPDLRVLIFTRDERIQELDFSE